MVPTAGLEPAQIAPLAPQTSASTNFATSAYVTLVQISANHFLTGAGAVAGDGAGAVGAGAANKERSKTLLGSLGDRVPR